MESEMKLILNIFLNLLAHLKQMQYGKRNIFDLYCLNTTVCKFNKVAQSLNCVLSVEIGQQLLF